MTAGGTYWVSISNATDAANDGCTSVGTPQTAVWAVLQLATSRQSGTNFGDCGVGGESFTIPCCGPPVPEPSSILLFGSGILGIAGILRRKLNH